jgi:AcrR family transcriptional regulator
VEKLTREERKAQTREALIRAGCDVVRARGFSVSVEEIANAAGYTKGAVYSNFDGRVDLIKAIAERVLVDAQGAIDPAATSLADALETEARRLAKQIDASPDLIVMTLDLFVTGMREPALGHRLMTEMAGQREIEWPEHLMPPIELQQFWYVLNALSAGLGMHRLMFGEKAVPDDLFAWAFRQLARTD